MDVRILGPLEVRDGEGRLLPVGGGKQSALLARLLVDVGRVVATERLIDDLWGEEPPATAVKSVQVYVSRLRKVLPSGLLTTRPPGYALDLPPAQVDLYRFEQLLAGGREALAGGGAEEAASLLRQALGLWRGPALAEFPEPFAQGEATRLEELRLVCLEERIEADLAAGRHTDVAGELEALVARHPLRERLRGQLMLALYRSGRQAEALSAYQAFRRSLDAELGLEPSPRLRELERLMLRQDPSVAPPPASQAMRPRARPATAPVAPEPPAASVDLVGREDELGRLRALLADALSGSRRLVFVTGEAGIGKTTLVEAFLAEAGAGEALLVGRGQCLEQHGAGEPYMPVLEAIGRLCRAAGGEALVKLLGERAPSWLVQMPWLVEARELEPLEQRIRGTTRERMLREMLETLDAVAAEQPLALVLEDLHWSDPSTLDLIDAVARRQDPARLLVVGTFRPDGPRGGDPVLNGMARNLQLRGLAAELALGTLTESAVGEYLALRCPGSELAPGLADLLHERTRGSPIFVEKVVDGWVEQGSLQEEDLRWRLSVELEALAGQMPESLRQLIEQRLSELGDEEQELLAAASATGAEFSAALVAAALERSDDEVEGRCSALARHSVFIEARGEEEWPDGTLAGRYGFTHDLYQETLYEALPAGRRSRLHGRIGARLERAYGERTGEIASELASQFVRARDAGRAMPHLQRAAEQALARSASREAIEHLTTGLALLESRPDDEERRHCELTLQTMVGPAWIGAKGWASPEAEAALRRGRELAEELDRGEELRQTLFKLATLYEVRGDYELAETLLEESVDLAGDQAPAGALVDSHELLACSLFHQGAFDRALEHAEEGLSFYDGRYANLLTAAYGDNAGVGCHTWAGLALWFLGHPDEARRRVREAVTLASDPRRLHGLATAQAHAAVVSQCRLEAEDAREWAEAAISSAAARGFAYRLAMGRILRGWALAVEGKSDEGIEELQGGLEFSRSTGARMDDPYYLGLLADACSRAERHDDALAALAEALELVLGNRAFFFEAELHRLRGVVLLRLGRDEQGEASLWEAVRVARRQGSPSLELRSAVSLGRLRLDQGRAADGATLVAAAYARFSEGFDTPDLVQAQALVDEVAAAHTPVSRGASGRVGS